MGKLSASALSPASVGEVETKRNASNGFGRDGQAERFSIITRFGG
jgi:hypothetical protein